MEALGYYIFYAINWVITLLPLPALYLISDFTFIFLYYIPGYRKKVVRKNLRNSFPEKSIDEIRVIEKKFYHHLCDMFIETFKLVHMSNKQLLKRMHNTNPELLYKLYDEGRDIALVLGHYANWEWLCIFPLSTKHQTVTIYKPLHNRYFDRFMINLRSRNKMIISPMSGIVREILRLRSNKIRALYAFIADQSPPKGEIKYWANFLNQDTPVYLGIEKIATKYDMAVVFMNIQKVRRGYYNFTSEMILEHTNGLPAYMITDAHIKRLEEIIKERPELWLWSHRRWKYTREKNDA